MNIVKKRLLALVMVALMMTTLTLLPIGQNINLFGVINVNAADTNGSNSERFIAKANPSGSLNSASALTALKETIKAAAKGTTSVTVNTSADVNAISAASLVKIADAAKAAGVSAKLKATVKEEKGTAVGNVTIPANSTTKTSIKTGVIFDDKTIDTAVDAYEKSYGEKILASFKTVQKSSFGVKISYSLSTKTLGLDNIKDNTTVNIINRRSDGKTFKITGTVKNGKLVFATTNAGIFMISNKAETGDVLKAAPADKPFTAEGKDFLNSFNPADKNDYTWTNKSYDGIRYIEAYKNDNKKKPIIFVLHGGGGRKEQVMWELEAYAREGFYAVAIDVAGHGESDRGPMVNLDAWIETVGYIDTLLDYYEDSTIADASSFAVGGSSMGGSITFLYGVIGEHTPKVLMPELGAPDFTTVIDGRLNDTVDHGGSRGPTTVTPELKQRAVELSAVSNIEKLADIPMWACFGGADPMNDLGSLQEFMKLLKDAGGDIQSLTIVPGGGHGGFSWEYYETRIPYLKKYMVTT